MGTDFQTILSFSAEREFADKNQQQRGEYRAIFKTVTKHFDFNLNVPWSDSVPASAEAGYKSS